MRRLQKKLPHPPHRPPALRPGRHGGGPGGGPARFRHHQSRPLRQPRSRERHQPHRHPGGRNLPGPGPTWWARRWWSSTSGTTCKPWPTWKTGPWLPSRRMPSAATSWPGRSCAESASTRSKASHNRCSPASPCPPWSPPWKRAKPTPGSSGPACWSAWSAKAPSPQAACGCSPPRGEVGDCRVTSRLYPGWAFAAASGTPPALSREVLLALLALAPDDEGQAWTVPADYHPVHELLRELQIGPLRLPAGAQLALHGPPLLALGPGPGA